MKGLILKDFYVMKKHFKIIFLIILVFNALSIVNNNSVFFIFYPALFAGTMPMSLLSYDEHYHWDKYSATLPYSKSQLVSVKYIISIICEVVVITLSILAAGTNMIINDSFNIETLFNLFILLISLALILPALSLPFMFKLGVEKGRIVYYVAIGIACAMSFIMSDAAATNQTQTTVIANYSFPLPALIIALVAAATAYALSWLISISFYKKREF